MHLRTLLSCALVAAVALLAGSARADTGTFSGSITPTDCGPMHPINVATVRRPSTRRQRRQSRQTT